MPYIPKPTDTDKASARAKAVARAKANAKANAKATDSTSPSKFDGDAAKPIVLENWNMQMMGTEFRLTGNVYGHPKFPDGAQIITSPVQRHMPHLNMAHTKNTLYFLKNRRTA